jgi:L-lactate dehydrogenase complex protein LldG
MSATADMGEAVRGVHGPREVHVVIVEDTNTDESDRPGEER